MSGARYLVAAVLALAAAWILHRWLAAERRALIALAAQERDAPAAQLARAESSGTDGSARTIPPAVPPPVHAAALLAGALAFAWATETWYAAVQAWLLLVALYALAALDWIALEVDQRIVLGALVLRLGSVALWERAGLPRAALGMVAGAGMIVVAALAYRALRGRHGLGDGDAGVMALAGAFVGPEGLIATLLVSAASGVFIGLATLLALRKPLTTPIPFVPFLCLGSLAVYLAQRLGLTLAGWAPY